jgi:hypothetical protein
VLIVARASSPAEDHEIEALPLLLGAVLFSAGLALLKRSAEPAQVGEHGA